ncbi:hypothetical protein C1646_759965 [Rhizophagus diaphanus]|nr:hypothetical protein C1646_759965 [Rhizophagus diaphanus] [Rhizophagus sp. MUCL 43196]
MKSFEGEFLFVSYQHNIEDDHYLFKDICISERQSVPKNKFSSTLQEFSGDDLNFSKNGLYGKSKTNNKKELKYIIDCKFMNGSVVKEENVINIIADNSLIYIIEKFSDENSERRRLNNRRRLLEEIWKTCYDDVRDKIWLQCCKEVEKADGIVAKDKKRKLMEENNKLDSDTEKINKIKQIIDK